MKCILPQYSLVVERDENLVAMAFTVVVRGTHYIDPVATASAYKRSGIGAAIVSTVLQMLADDGVVNVGAVITEGNLASERLFLSLGFEQVGVWRSRVVQECRSRLSAEAPNPVAVTQSRSPGAPEPRSPGAPEPRSPGAPEPRSPGLSGPRTPG